MDSTTVIYLIGILHPLNGIIGMLAFISLILMASLGVYILIEKVDADSLEAMGFKRLAIISAILLAVFIVVPDKDTGRDMLEASAVQACQDD